MNRNIVLVVITAAIVLAITMPDAQAALMTTHMDEVGILASNPDGILNLTAYNLSAPAGAELQYGTGEDFMPVTEPIILNGDQTRIFFQLALPGEPPIQAGDLTFSGGSDPFFTNVAIKWDYQDYSFSLVAGNCGTLIAHAPIPAPALLLCTGVIGLIVFRKRTRGQG